MKIRPLYFPFTEKLTFGRALSGEKLTFGRAHSAEKVTFKSEHDAKDGLSAPQALVTSTILINPHEKDFLCLNSQNIS